MRTLASRFAVVLVAGLAPTAAAGASLQCPASLVIDTVLVQAGGDAATGLATRVLNALHRRTRPGVIRRTVLLHAGDCYDRARAAESERALWALSVFRAVRVGTLRAAGGGLALRVATTDGWTARPVADYSRAGAAHSWVIGYFDGNFLGTASRMLASYGSTPDRSTLALEYVNPHTTLPGVVVSLRHAVLSNGRQTSWSAALPFRETASRYSASLTGERIESVPCRTARLGGAAAPARGPCGCA